MNTNLVNIVKKIIADYGENILANPQRLKSFFSDLAKDEPKPLRVAFGRCIEAGAYTALKGAPDAGERASRKAAIAQRLRDDMGLDAALCAEALDVLEVALFGGVSSPPAASQYRQSAGPQVRVVYVPPSAPASPPPVTPHSQHSYSAPTAAAFTPYSQNPQAAAQMSAGGKKISRNVLIAVAAVAAIILIFVFVVGGQHTPLMDTELREMAISIASTLDSDAFEGFDPAESITHYYFIPVTSMEALGLAAVQLLFAEFNYVYAWSSDSGVEKARRMGYNAEFGVIVCREDNERDGEILICPAQVYEKKEPY
ncbi:MAG: hypothetical protein Ta2A_14240 [Treponemataceae bacterium]|nr:MAG: hypothetical protein Ta2A_14240 [Treponemataceae bacterium]